LDCVAGFSCEDEEVVLVEGARFVVGLVEDCYASNGCFVGGTIELVEFERGGYVKT
jgi:hypothetical protein